MDFDPGAGVMNLISKGDFDIFIQKLDAKGELIWVKQIGGIDTYFGKSITIGSSGNIYTTGSFSGEVDFDPGVGTSNLGRADNRSYIFIQKLNNDGDLIWAKKVDKGNGSGFGRSIATDASGNVYTTGIFLNTMDFDPGMGTTNLTSKGKYDAFIQKLDPSGDLLWAKQIGGILDVDGNAIKTDATGNVYITGTFTGTADLDPDAVAIENFTSRGEKDIFVQKLKADGTFIWTKQMGGVGNEFNPSLAFDVDGNIYSTGLFSGTADFGTISLTTTIGSSESFIQKLATNGSFLWVKKVNSNGGISMTTDKVGNLYTTGSFKGTVDFDLGTAVFNLTSNGGKDAFIQKLNVNGELIWVEQFGGVSENSSVSGRLITIDADNNIYTSGNFTQEIDFDPSTATTNMKAIGGYDIFIQKLSTISPGQEVLINSITVQGEGGVSTITADNGTLQMEASVLPANATDQTVTWSVADGTGSATISDTGLLTAMTDGAVIVTATANDASGKTGSEEITISNQIILGINETAFNMMSVYPISFADFITIDTETEISTAKIYSLDGSLIIDNLTISSDNKINVSKLTSGTYILVLTDGNDQVYTQKIIK